MEPAVMEQVKKAWEETRSFSLEQYEANRPKSTVDLIGRGKLPSINAVDAAGYIAYVGTDASGQLACSPYVPVTGEQVKSAVLKTDIKYVNVRECGICKSPIGYYVHAADLVFDGSCECCRGENFRPDQWTNAAEWINMQTRLVNRIDLMKKFALLPGEYEVSDEH
jgi:hypothetical protein